MKSIYVANGECIFHDPGPEMIPAFLAMNKGFQIESIRPQVGFIPKFQFLKKQDIFLEDSPLEYSAEDLMETLNSKAEEKKGTRYSALDIFYVLCLKSLSNCSWCGWNCKVNRFNEKGKCGLSSIVYASPAFIHIAEETPINPCLVTNLGACSMHCRYCIDHRLLNPATLLRPLDTNRYWQEAKELVDGSTNSIEFTNPTESLHGIMHILLNVPNDMRLPLVMNCHLYGSHEFYRLADPITDVWLPDLRYGNNECAKSLSRVDHYMEQATAGLDSICKRGNRVIVRILVLPGHVSCCHGPALKLLSKYKSVVWVSVLEQYVPEYKAHLDANMARRPSKEEIQQVIDLVKKHGLRNVAECGTEFWND